MLYVHGLEISAPNPLTKICVAPRQSLLVSDASFYSIKGPEPDIVKESINGLMCNNTQCKITARHKLG